MRKRPRRRDARNTHTNKRDPLDKLRMHLFATKFAKSRLASKRLEDSKRNQKTHQRQLSSIGPDRGHGHQRQKSC